MRPEYIKGNARAAELESLRDERNRWVDKKRDYESEFAALRSQVEELGRDRKEARDAFERMVSERERLSAQVEELTRELDDIKSQEHYCPDCKMLCQYCSCWSETNARLEEQVGEANARIEAVRRMMGSPAFIFADDPAIVRQQIELYLQCGRGPYRPEGDDD